MKIKNRLAKDRAMLWTVCLFAILTAVPLFAILGECYCEDMSNSLGRSSPSRHLRHTRR